MANTDKSRAAALAALRTYQAQPGFTGNEDVTSLKDLIVDLAHLADTFEGENTVDGDFILHDARDIYNDEYEEDEDSPRRFDDDNPYGDEGQTIPDDPNIPAGAENPMDKCTIPCDGTGWTGNPHERCTTHYEPNF